MKPKKTLRDAAAEAPSATFNIARREFLQRCGRLAAMTGLPLWFVERQQLEAAQATNPVTPSDRPGIGIIGCGGMGKGDATNASAFGDILAVCDVDESHAAAFAKDFTVEGKAAPTVYRDFRKVMERRDIHIIVNATPDHWHTLVNLAAAQAKKDVYGEKPLTLTVDEGRHIVKAVRDHRIVLQTGTQQRSSQRFRLACELVRNGRLGKLKQARVWLPAGLREGPFKPSPVPAGLDWDFWQGQAPAADYVTERCHRTFRFWYEYSGGTMTDWGAHHNDIAYWAIGLLAPREVTAKHFSEPVPGGYNAYADYEVNYTYANGIGLQINTTKDDSIFGEKLNPAGPAQRNPLRRQRRLALGQPRRDRRQRSAVAADPAARERDKALREQEPHGQLLRLRALARAAHLRRGDGPSFRDHVPSGGDRASHGPKPHLGLHRREVRGRARAGSQRLPGSRDAQTLRLLVLAGVHDHAVAALLLGLVEGLVGRPQDGLGRVLGPGAHGLDPEADRHHLEGRPLVRDLQAFDALAHLLGHQQRTRGLGTGKHHPELLASVASREVAAPAQHPRDLDRDVLQAVVPALVAVVVVEGLEEVHVDEHHAERRLVA